MNKTAAIHGPAPFRLRSFWIALLVSSALLLSGLGDSASARRHPLIGGDGKIHACYRVKGKPRWNLRVVRSRKTRCRRGERKVAWAATAVPGPAGTGGAQGMPGTGGSQSALTTKLTEQVNSLSTRVDSLEATLQNVTNEDLTAAIDSLPLVESLCEQSEDLTKQVNLLGGAIGDLGLSAPLEAIGVLEIPELPEPLEQQPLSCTIS